VINPDVEPWVQFVTEAYLVKHLRVSRIMADLRSKGFTGGKSALYRWIGEELKPRRDAQSAQAFQPYERDITECCGLGKRKSVSFDAHQPR
jgi:hypothetical protein